MQLRPFGSTTTLLATHTTLSNEPPDTVLWVYTCNVQWLSVAQDAEQKHCCDEFVRVTLVRKTTP